MRKLIIQIFFFLLCGLTTVSVSAQKIEKDTSYTVQSSFLRYKTKFPNIRIAKADTAGIAIQEHVIYCEFGNRKLSLDIYASRNLTARQPAIFMVHGGGWKSGDKSHMRALGSALAANGYTALAMEYRLSPEARYPAGVIDIKTAIQWVTQQASTLQIDTSKLILLGCSSGAQLATLVGMTANETDRTIKAVVNLDGILAFHHPESEEGASAALWLGGTYEEAPENWEQAAPLNHTGPGDPPILFINSQYPRFHAGRDEVIEILTDQSIYTEVHTLPNTPHTFWLFDPWFSPTLDYILTFLNQTVLR